MHPMKITATVLMLTLPAAAGALAQSPSGSQDRGDSQTMPGAGPATQSMGAQDPAASTMGTAAAPGATGTGSSDSMTASAGSEVLVEVEKPTAGSSRSRLAQTQTALLNRFSQLGFSDVKEFRREGETYVSEARTADGDWVSVVLDPQSGTIIARR
ncbi:hypothetical protein [Oleisolibacter albus]|uniref:hypothetical protein n=1 Tax=Oleisolibacter albus TaxID=2171757 RepID=UPI000DF34168|nr:hypothetical protein [Oleisolibacter albus]